MLEMLKGNFGCGTSGVEAAVGSGEKARSAGEGGGKGEAASGEKVVRFQVQEEGAESGPASPHPPVSRTYMGRL
jgi:hypothetical protein